MDERERGQSAVEFAMASVLLVLIFLAVLDFGRVFNAALVITNAAREGAYYGGMHPQDDAGIVAHVLQEAQDSGISLAASTVTITPSSAAARVSGTPIRVTVEYEFALISTMLLGTHALTLRRTAEMVIY